MRWRSGLFALLGLKFIIGGVVLAAVVVPLLEVFPDDVATTLDFEVEYLTLLDPETLTFTDVPAGEANDIMIRREITTEDVNGDVVMIREDQRLLNGAQVLQNVTFRYPVDRKTLEQRDDVLPEWAAADGLWAREGLVIGWGVDPEPRDYIGWNEDTRQPEVIAYEGRDEINGFDAYYFTSSSEPKRINPAQVEVLGLLPELTIEQVAGLARSLEVDDPIIGRLLTTALPRLMENAVRETQNIPADVPTEDIRVPLEFYYDYDGQYWVEPETGVLLNTVKHEHRAATFPQEIIEHLAGSVEGLGQDRALIDDLLPLTVSDFRYTGTDAAVQAQSQAAQAAIDQLNLYGQTIPLLLGVVGGALLLGAGLFVIRTVK